MTKKPKRFTDFMRHGKRSCQRWSSRALAIATRELRYGPTVVTVHVCGRHLYA